MEHFDLNKIKFETNLFDLALNKFYINSKNSYSYIGINYHDQSVLSLKFYYVFFDIIQFKNHFPIENLKIDFDEYINDASDMVYEPRSNGGGLTIVIKFNQNADKAVGFYLRCNGDNSQYVSNIINCYPELNLNKNDFESGFGRYVMFQNELKENNIYLYLKPNLKLATLENQYGIAYSKSRGIEISCANSMNINKHKFIALGGAELMSNDFIAKIPDTFKQLAKSLNSVLICPAMNKNGSIFTSYIYNNSINLVREFVK